MIKKPTSTKNKIQFLELSESKRLKFYKALYDAKANKFISLIEKYDVEINSIIDEFGSNFLIEAISDCSSEFKGSENQLEIVKYLLDKGIDVNHKTKKGYTSLDIALEYTEMTNISLLLVQAKNANFHKSEKIAHATIVAYSKAWREEYKKERALLFEVIEVLLQQNVSLKGCYEFLKILGYPELFILLKKYGHTLASLKKMEDEVKIDTNINIDELHNKINKKNYDKTAKVIWQKLVPSRGQADTIQGELLRAIEKLRDEAQRNGNVNFHKNCHSLLLKFLKETLLDKTIFTKEELLTLKTDLKKISYKTMPYTEDDAYDNITKRMIDWYLANPKQIPNPKNDALYC